MLPVPADPLDLPSLVSVMSERIATARQRSLTAISREMVLLYWELGRHIVEFEQGGAERAGYGEGLIPALAGALTRAHGSGFSARNLANFRGFYRAFPNFADASAKLSWSHIVRLLRVEDDLARQFYVKQCGLDGWSVRELDRQVNSMLFERLALSTDKEGVLALARAGHRPQRPEDLLKDPFVFEFLGLAVDHALSETELEARLIGHLQEMLLELGRGFCFVARQKRITVGPDHFYIDLVFYHRILKCFVLIDLKMEPFKPADAGQMNFYLNWMKEQEGAVDDNPPVGILLCMDRNELYVKYATMGMENLVLAGRFALQLPDPEQLSRAVAEVLRDADAGAARLVKHAGGSPW
jgi:predicted nuclease of restriction endonuclease-like (RecB) superfamily